MKKYMFFFQIFALCLCINEQVMADEQVFKINNPLSNIDVTSEAKNYEDKVDYLLDDIVTDGVVFSGGKETRVISGNGDSAKFILTNVLARLKRTVIDQYQNEFSTMPSKLIWEKVRHDLGEHHHVFGRNNMFIIADSLIYFQVQLRDNQDRNITEQRFDSNFGSLSNGLVPLSFFLEKCSSESNLSNMSHFDEYGNQLTYPFNNGGDLELFFGNISFDLPISQIQKIDHVVFKAVRNTRLSP